MKNNKKPKYEPVSGEPQVQEEAENLELVQMVESNIKYQILSEQLKNNIDIQERVIYIEGDIKEDTHLTFHKNASLIINSDPGNTDPITIIIDSPGGFLSPGFAIIDLIDYYKKEMGILFHTFAFGRVSSMGAYITIAGTGERIANKSCVFLIHEIQSGRGDMQNKSQLDLDHDMLSVWDDRMYDLLKRTTKKSSKWWKEKLKHKDVHMFTDEAVSLGLIDRVV